MTPRLVLLTGPVAGKVAAVFREMVNGDALRYVTGNGPASTWDEVRDYWVAPRQIALGDDHGLTEGRIRSLPGGEEWLVGLVLPTPHPYINLTCGHTHWRCSLQWGCKVCRGYYRLPARLAILAPEPPPLLVERVRAWGGEVWWCSRREEPTDCLITCDKWIPPHPAASADYDVIEDTWPEAVRAALGEVAP